MSGFKKNLVEDLEDDTSGHFRRVLVGIAQGNRSEDPVVDQTLVTKDAEDLRKVSKNF